MGAGNGLFGGPSNQIGGEAGGAARFFRCRRQELAPLDGLDRRHFSRSLDRWRAGGLEGAKLDLDRRHNACVRAKSSTAECDGPSSATRCADGCRIGIAADRSAISPGFGRGFVSAGGLPTCAAAGAQDLVACIHRGSSHCRASDGARRSRPFVRPERLILAKPRARKCAARQRPLSGSSQCRRTRPGQFILA